MNHTIWGMIHIPPLPGAYKNTLSIKEIEKYCLNDVHTLTESGINNLLIENYGDIPFPKQNALPHVISGLSRIITMIKHDFPEIEVGVNVLRNDALSALGIAKICGCKFIRVNVLTHARLTDQGIIEGQAYKLKQYQQLLKSDVEIWADIEVKHSIAIAPVPLVDAITDSLNRAGADKIIFSGLQTGHPADLSIIKPLIKKKIITPEQVVIGSGISHENLSDYCPIAHNFIVGTNLKEHGLIQNPVNPSNVKRLKNALLTYYANTNH